MNRFLYNFALKLRQIRDLLGLTQMSLSEKTGISKPTLVGIEGNPSKLSRPYALALFVVITSEMDRRDTIANQADFADTGKAYMLLKDSGFTLKSLQIGMNAYLGNVDPNARSFLALPLLDHRGNPTADVRFVDSPTLKKIVDQSVLEIRKEIILLLGVTSLSTTEFFQSIEDNEPKPETPK